MPSPRPAANRLARTVAHLRPTAASFESGGVTFYTLDEAGAPAKGAGLRITMLPGLPGLWAEALKNLCDVKRVPYVRVLHPFGDYEQLYKLTAQRSLPTMFYNDDPPRSALIEQIRLAERLGAQDAPRLIPTNIQDRVLMFGLLNELAGEGGIVYTVRLMGGKEKDGKWHPGPLAVKYGYTAEARANGEQLVIDGLNALNAQLVAQKDRGSKFFVGDSLSVLDVYWATMSLMFGVPNSDIMPRTKQNKALLAGFVPGTPAIAAAVTPLLMEHREYIYRNFLVIPAVIGGDKL